MVDAIKDYFLTLHASAAPHLPAIGFLSMGFSLATIVIVPVVIRIMPADYYTSSHKVKISSFSLGEILLAVLKNVIGFVLVLAGIAMIVLPGQGVLTIILGLALMNFPGKRRIEIWLFHHKTVSKSLNWLRQKMHQPPFHSDEIKASDR